MELEGVPKGLTYTGSSPNTSDLGRFAEIELKSHAS